MTNEWNGSARRCDPNIASDYNGKTALILAAEGSNADALSLLLRYAPQASSQATPSLADARGGNPSQGAAALGGQGGGQGQGGLDPPSLSSASDLRGRAALPVDVNQVTLLTVTLHHVTCGVNLRGRAALPVDVNQVTT